MRDEGVDGRLRYYAAMKLDKLGRVKDIMALIRDEQVTIRDALTVLIGDFGHVEEMLALARDEGVSLSVRTLAVNYMTLEDLLVLIRDEGVDPIVRLSAVNGLVALGIAKKDIEKVLALVRDEGVDSEVRRGIVGWLINFGHVEEVLELARDKGTKTGSIAAYVLGEAQYLKELYELAQDEQVDGWVRTVAAWWLGEWGHKHEAVAILLPLAQNEQMTQEQREYASRLCSRFASS